MYFNHQLGLPISALQKKAIQETHLALYSLVGASKHDHLIFTSSGAEAVNHTIFSAYLDITRSSGKNHFLCLNTDEMPTLMSFKRLEDLGACFQMIPVNSQGIVTQKTVAEMLTPRTCLLSVSAANGLTGVIQPLFELADLCHERGVLFHVDATHILGKIPFDFQSVGIDVLTFQSEYPGTGGLFIKEGREMSAWILGGNEQTKMRAGRMSPSCLIECGKYAQKSAHQRDHYCIEIARLKTLFEERISECIPDITVVCDEIERVPHITALIFPGVTSQALACLLNQKGVHTTFGENQFQHISHLLKAYGIAAPNHHCGLSFAFSHQTTEQDIEKGAQTVIDTVLFLQKCSQHILTL